MPLKNEENVSLKQHKFELCWDQWVLMKTAWLMESEVRNYMERICSWRTCRVKSSYLPRCLSVNRISNQSMVCGLELVQHNSTHLQSAIFTFHIHQLSLKLNGSLYICISPSLTIFPERLDDYSFSIFHFSNTWIEKIITFFCSSFQLALFLDSEHSIG